MSPITVLFSVKIKARVTDRLKRKLAAEMQDALKRLEIEIQQLDFQVRRMTAELQRTKSPDMEAFKKQVEIERGKREERKSELLERIKEVARLEPGTEIYQGTVEAVKQLEVGDDWERLSRAEILLEDGVVVEIRI